MFYNWVTATVLTFKVTLTKNPIKKMQQLIDWIVYVYKCVYIIFITKRMWKQDKHRKV